MLYYSNAKINLGLHIVEKRPDQFHNIESVFYPLPLSDALECKASDKEGISNSGIIVGGNATDNLILKAYRLLVQDYTVPTTDFHIHKSIPIGAGLGGGSANAAYTLKAINQLYNLKLGNEKLTEYARILGSDCAFFIENKPVLATEKGDVFSPCSVDLSGYYILVVHPNIMISTPRAYAKVKPRKGDYDLIESLNRPVGEWRECVHNHFEDALFGDFPILKNIKEELYKEGALYASMSGSGSALYGIFKKEINSPSFEKFWTWGAYL